MRWPLTGRTEELDALCRTLGPDIDAGGITLFGSAGVGKTRLAREVALIAENRGWAVRWVLGTAATHPIPMGAFVQWTEALDGNPLQLVRQVIETLRRSTAGSRLLVVADDAHLLDDLSAFVLLQLAVRDVGTVIATVRTGERCPQPVSDLWQDGHLARLDLQPLSRPDTTQLLNAVLPGHLAVETDDRMWEMSQGNVLYLRQLVEQERHAGRLIETSGSWRWTGRLDVSPTLAELVELQIGRGATDLHDVLDMVAIAEPLERSCLVDLVDPAVVDEAEQRGLITTADAGNGAVAQVGHPLYGEVRLARAGSLRLLRLRGQVAQALAENPDADPVRVGRLWLESDLDPHPHLMLRAAQHATLRMDLVLAERFASAAVAAGAGPDAEASQAHLLVLLNQGEAADRILSTIASDTVSEETWANILHLRIANLLWPLGRPESAAQLIDEVLRDQLSGARSAYVHAVRAVQLAMAARPVEVIAAVQDLQLRDLPALPAVVALWALTIAHGDLGSPAQAADCAQQGYQRAAGSPEATYQGVGIGEFHVTAMGLAGLIDDAVESAEHISRRCRDAPGITHSVSRAIRGMAALFAGDLATALADLDTACADFERYGDTTGVFYRFSVVYTDALARAGRQQEATAMQAKMEAARHPTFVYIESDKLLADAWVAAGKGHVTHARQLVSSAAEFARTHTQNARELYSLQILLQLGGASRGTTRRVQELAGKVSGPRAQLVSAYAIAAEGRNPQALAVVAAEFDRAGDPLAAADAFAQASLMFTEQNLRGSALSAVTRASAIMQGCGAVSPATNAAVHPLPLSAREREVASMASNGMSNRDIATALGVPQRTVEGHVYRSCAKLGVANRRELAGLLARKTSPHRCGTACVSDE